ncbi:MAG TPA: hypothetical protein VD906_01880 [Caulobacteraceae bacterium]|nr:hypothetical protein [Caulobacteraceae bacterium]
MTERTRPILRLKNPPKLAPLAPPAPSWKCKPCGTPFAPSEAAQDGEVRCPKCNARLGQLEDFTADPPRAEKVRARPIKAQTRSG